MTNNPFAGIRTRTFNPSPHSSPFEGIRTRSLPQESSNSNIDLSLLERVGQLGRGVASGYGGLADIANQYVASPLLNLAGGAAELAGKGLGYLSPDAENYLQEGANKAYQARDYYQGNNTQGDIQNVIDEATNDRLQGKDTLGKILNTTGEFLGPTPALKTLNVIKAPLGVQALESLGGATGIHTLPDITGNETIDNFLKGIVGMYASKKVNPETEKKLLDLIKGNKLAEKVPLDQKIIGKALSYGAKPEEELLNTAKELNVELPNYLKLNSPVGNVTEKTISKSLFSSPKYKEQQARAHRSFIDAFDENVNRIHPEYENLETAGTKAAHALKDTERNLFNQSESLYQDAYKKLSPQDKVIPKNTLETTERLKKGIEGIPAPAEGDKFLKPKLSSIEDKWGLPKSVREELEGLKRTLAPDAYEQVKEKLLAGSNQVEVPTLTAQRSALLKDLRERSTLKGARKELGELVESLNKDIGEIGEKNPNFIEAWKKANKFYKEEYASTVKSKIGDAILNGDSPKEVTKYLNSSSDINALSHILKNIPDHSKIMDMLKRAKYQDLVVDKIKNSDGTLSYSNLANLFTKRSKIDPLLRTVGGETDTNMRKLAQIAQRYVKTGKEVANPSGTAGALENSNALGNVMHAILSVGVGGLGAIKSAGVSIASPFILTKIMSNQKYIDQAIKYALARKNDKARKTALEKMQSIFKNEILTKNILNNSHIKEERKEK